MFPSPSPTPSLLGETLAPWWSCLLTSRPLCELNKIPLKVKTSHCGNIPNALMEGWPQGTSPNGGLVSPRGQDDQCSESLHRGGVKDRATPTPQPRL